MNEPINAEVVSESRAVAVREQNMAVDRPMTVDEVSQRLDFVKQVMGTVMVDGQDYGKIPGCGDKPGLFQPGAQKLALTFQLSPTVEKEILRELGNGHREYEFTLAISTASSRVLAHGVGTCSTFEAKYRYRGGERKCPECGKPAIIKGKAEFGGGWLCFAKKGGCGAKFDDKDQAIVGQNVGRSENPDPADSWNTVRKMAFKRALVHGMINATNTSELWSQDLEDLNLHDDHEPVKAPPAASGASRPPTPTPKPQSAPKASPAPARPTPATTPKATEATRKWMVEQLLVVRDPAMAFAIDKAIIMPNETLEDWPMDQVPTSKAEMDRLIVEIRAYANAPSKPPEPPREDRNDPDTRHAKPDLTGTEVIEDVIVNVTLKEGKKKTTGEAWSLWGINMGGKWFNTFSNTIGQLASANKGKCMVLHYRPGEKGNDAVHLEQPDTLPF